ncbi:MAG: hypothetical protein HKN76_10735, partial [Saprospiraceae bacterium]|nr:hypothetical protein [Saprospiraceae bacterium]
MRENTELLTSTANWERVFNELLTRHIPVLIILMVMAGSTMSQSQIPKKMIDSLKESEFVFVIPTSHEKLVALQNQSESATNSRLRKRQQALFLAEKMNQDSFETALRKAVQQHFSFAKYSFLHDTALGPLTAAHVNETTPSFLVMRSYA